MKNETANTQNRARANKVEGYKKLNGGKWITKERRLAIYMRDNFSCCYCGCSLKNIEDPKGIALDHLLPRVAGGNNDSTNLITVCRSCNSKRSDRPWVDYATGGAIDRINQQRYAPVNIALAKALIAGQAKDEETENLR